MHYVQERCLTEPTHLPNIRLDEIYLPADDDNGQGQQKLKSHLRHWQASQSRSRQPELEGKVHKELLKINCNYISDLKLPYHFQSYELDLQNTLEFVMKAAGADCRAVFIDNSHQKPEIFYNNNDSHAEDMKRMPLYTDKLFVTGILRRLSQEQTLCILMNFNFLEYYIKRPRSDIFMVSEISHYSQRYM